MREYSYKQKIPCRAQSQLTKFIPEFCTGWSYPNSLSTIFFKSDLLQVLLKKIGPSRLWLKEHMYYCSANIKLHLRTSSFLCSKPLQPFSSHHGKKQIKPALGLFAASSPNWLFQWILPRGCMASAHRLKTLLSLPQEDQKDPLLSFPILPHFLLSVALIK